MAFFAGLILLSAYLIATGCALKSSCKVVANEKSGQLICEFTEDIGKLKYDFNVQRYDLEKGHKFPDIVLACNWIEPGGLDCYAADTYRFTSTVSNKVVIDIPQLRKEHLGRYLCQVISNVSEDVTFCAFLQQPDVPKVEKADETVLPPADSKHLEPPGLRESTSGMVAGLVVMAMLLGCSATGNIVFVWYVKKQWNQRVESQPEQRNTSHDSMLPH